MAGNHAVLNEGEENEMEIFGYKSERWRKVLCLLGYIFSVGLLKLVFYWKPELKVWGHCVPCNLADADVILLRTTGELKDYIKKLVIQVTLNRTMKPGYPVISDENSIICRSIMEPEGKVRYIQVQKIRYVWIPSENKFVKTGVLEESLSCSDIHSKYGFGLTKEEQEVRRQICGLNTITVKIIPVWKLLSKQIFNPFYVFQAYTLSIWMATSYVEYSLSILFMTIVSISATVYNLRKQSVKLNRMSTSYNSILVSVLHKNGELEEVSSQSLVPGDVIVLGGNKLFLPCDAILISGGCTVNEAMLTGESIPVTKTPLPNINNSIPWMAHSGEDYKKHVLYCGTEVIQAKRHSQDLVKAVVLQTAQKPDILTGVCRLFISTVDNPSGMKMRVGHICGFNTAKGDLVRAILYNKPMNVKLHREAIRFLMVLVAFSILGVIYTAAVYIMNGASVHDTVVMSFLMLTVGINAALPASLTLCLLYGQIRLKKKGIFCISPQRINLAGQLNLICFDKTGTLTEDILDLYGVLPCEKSYFQDIILFKSSNNLCWCPILQAMTSCQSLITLDGELQGDPLDLKMFGGTGWEFEDYKAKIKEDDPLNSCTMVKPGPTAAKAPVEGILILHQFPFSSSLQRMSVITQVMGESNLTVFMKGAPEMVVRFCKPETVPDSFSTELEDYTVQGFRVIGLAYRTVLKEGLPEFSDIDREVVECDLTFLGLLILENRLKPETNSVLEELTEANIRAVMVTGDNLQTAVTVGKKSGMIPSNSNIIMLEACEPEKDFPASVTWKCLTEIQPNGNHKDKSQCNVGERLINIPTTLGNLHFAMNGKSYQVLTQHFSNLLPKILLNGTIFARMTPKQKSSLIEELQKLDYFVGMCGDGANDCGALKMAHVGISLSELEASVASPFTSKIPNIECVPLLIKEGRNTLITSLSIFKFLTMYQFIAIVCVVFLFWKLTLLGNYQYLLQDLAINIICSLTMSLNHAAPKLAPYRPSGQLFSPPLLLSIFMHLTFTVIVQGTAFFLLQEQPWFSETDVFSACLPLNYSTGNTTVRQHRYAENFFTTTMFTLTGFNLIIAEIVFAKGKPFRQPLYTNYLLSTLIIVQVVIYLFFLFADIDSLYTAIETVCTPYHWRVNILIMVLTLFFVSYIAEMWFIDNRELWLWIKRLFKYKSKSQYRKLQRKIQKDPEWPPQNRTDYAVQYISEEDCRIVVCNNSHYSSVPKSGM